MTNEMPMLEPMLRAMLNRLVANLLDNAIAYGAPPVDVYPAGMQADAQFCATLEKRPDAKKLLAPFVVAAQQPALAQQAIGLVQEVPPNPPVCCMAASLLFVSIMSFKVPLLEVLPSGTSAHFPVMTSPGLL